MPFRVVDVVSVASSGLLGLQYLTATTRFVNMSRICGYIFYSQKLFSPGELKSTPRNRDGGIKQRSSHIRVAFSDGNDSLFFIYR